MDIQLLKAANNIAEFVVLQHSANTVSSSSVSVSEESKDAASILRASESDDVKTPSSGLTNREHETSMTRRIADIHFSQAEEFKKSLPLASRLGVHFQKGTFKDEFSFQEAFLEVKIENQTQRFTKLFGRPYWNEMLVFDVMKIKTAVLRIRLLQGSTCYTADALGMVHIPLWKYATPEFETKTESYELFKRGTCVGKIDLRIIPHVERRHVPLKILCCTWNLGNQQPTDDLKDWFRLHPEAPYDLIAVGLQESTYKRRRSTNTVASESSDDEVPSEDQMTPKSIFGKGGVTFPVRRFGKMGSMLKADANNRTNIEDLLKDHLECDYLLLKSVTMWKMRLLIFAKTQIYPTISSVRCASQATGMAGVGQNKGGLAISFYLWDTHICFVNAHLAAHQDRVKARNSMYESLLRGIKIADHKMDLLTGFHHVFWMGDLNYRIDVDEDEDEQTPSGHAFTEIMEMCEAGRFEALLKRDQLKIQIQEGSAFYGFKEGSISFMPTFKVERSIGHNYFTHRLPAWCDRILYKSTISSREAELLDYYSVPEISSSDHKPVAAFFKVPTIFYGYKNDSTQKYIIVLAFKKLQAEGLFMLKKRNMKIATPPNPQVLLCTRGNRVYRTSVVYKKRDPIWNHALRIKIHEDDLEQLQFYRLMFRVVSRTNTLSGFSQTMGRGVLPLDVVNIRTSSKKFSFSFHVKLHYNCKYAGSLSGDIKISLKKQRNRSDGLVVGF